ncbi:Hypothetical Protein XCAW_03085 [Xanthomonas citri subsp. citri Aw12879]|nr:Hypothetical Protein XCAW_03085 [Xanthomonas citri subsp. citri Aw12879]
MPVSLFGGRSKRQQAPNSLAQTIVCSGSNRISL